MANNDSLLLPITNPDLQQRHLIDFSPFFVSLSHRGQSRPPHYFPWEPRDVLAIDVPRSSPIVLQPPPATPSSPPLMRPSSGHAILPPPLPCPTQVSFVPLGIPRPSAVPPQRAPNSDLLHLSPSPPSIADLVDIGPMDPPFEMDAEFLPFRDEEPASHAVMEDQEVELLSTAPQDTSGPLLISVSPPERIPIEPPPLPTLSTISFVPMQSPSHDSNSSPTTSPIPFQLPLPRSTIGSGMDQPYGHVIVPDDGWQPAGRPHARDGRLPRLRHGPTPPQFPHPSTLPNAGLGYEVNRFTSSVPRDLICPICLDVMNSPVETPCSHVFCQLCIHASLQHRLRCPVDRRGICPDSLRPLPPIVHRILGSLTLRCGHDGCKEEVALEHLAKHEGYCPFRPLE